MPPLATHVVVPIPGPWWLPLFVILGAGVAYFALSDDARLEAAARRRAAMAVAIGLVAGGAHWWVAQYALQNLVLAPDVQYRSVGHGPLYAPGVIIEALVCWGLTWLFTALLLQRQPELQGERYYDLVSRASGLAVAVIAVTNIVRVLVATW
jgi:hypothetical protein